MPVLSAWYLESVKERLPIVVIFEDFEGKFYDQAYNVEN
jgi:hypothetical protein